MSLSDYGQGPGGYYKIGTSSGPYFIDDNGVAYPMGGPGVSALPAGTSLIGKVGLDQTTPGTTDSVSTKGVGITATASFTPAAAAYLANDIFDVPKEFVFTFAATGLAIPAGSLIRVLTAITRIDTTSVPSNQTSYTLQGYSATPPSAQADNDAWTLASADLAGYRGPISLGAPADLGAALYVKSSNIDLDIKLVTSSLWGRLVTDAAFTAAAIARQVTLYGMVI